VLVVMVVKGKTTVGVGRVAVTTTPFAPACIILREPEG